MLEEFRWPLMFAAGCGFGCDTALMMMARVAAVFLALLLRCGGVVSCCVRCSCAFVCVWWRSLRHVMYNYFLFLNDAAVLMPLIKKKKRN